MLYGSENMNIYVLTLFPNMFSGFLQESIIGRAIRNNIIKINIFNIRDCANNKHGRVDDTPYGGGAGMVIQAPPLRDSLLACDWQEGDRVIYMSPRGSLLSHKKSMELSLEKKIYIVCGHYEGVDQRFIDKYVTDEISIGDYVLTGGELPAMVLMDATMRLIPNVIGKEESLVDESHTNGLLEYPQYTRPLEFDGIKVPDVLVSGHHQNISQWRLKKSMELTKKIRPDMFEKL